MSMNIHFSPQMESLGGIGGLGLGPNPPVPPTSSSGFPTSTSGFPATLASLVPTPGSPAKSFPTLGQPQPSQSQSFNPLQAITSQFQGM